MPRLLFTPGKDPVPIVQEAGWAPGPVWTGAENLAPTGIRSLDQLKLSITFVTHLRWIRFSFDETIISVVFVIHMNYAQKMTTLLMFLWKLMCLSYGHITCDKGLKLVVI